MTTDEYFSGEETNRRQELIFGELHEPPAPFANHQWVVTSLTTALHNHVRAAGIGAVYVSPLDVVLDRHRALILQPDVLFISTANASIVQDRVWGAPDLAVEVISSRSRRRDTVAKRAWYLRYGIKEYWLVDPRALTIEVITSPNGASCVYGADERLVSAVVPGFSPVVREALGS